MFENIDTTSSGLLSTVKEGLANSTPTVDPTLFTPDLERANTIYESAKSALALNSKTDTQSKYERLSVAAANKRDELRKDSVDYGNDSDFVIGAKSFVNEFLPIDWQLAVNKNGKRYRTDNKIFNDYSLEELQGRWNSFQEDPNGDKVLYYLKKLDGYNEDGSARWLYKPGIAHVSAADRYKSQLADSDWQLIAEKRFNEASTEEKLIQGSSAAQQYRAFDYDTFRNSPTQAAREGKLFSDFGSGTGELYTKDILGLDKGTAQQYEANKAKSKQAMMDYLTTPKERQDTFEFIDALQYGSVTLGGQAIKLIGEAVSSGEGDGAIESLGKKIIKDAAKNTGYNPKTADDAAAGLRAAWREGKPLDFISNMIKGSPQWLAQSVPNMAAFTATAAVTTATTANPIVGFMTAGSVMGALRANDILDQRETVNNGKKATTEEAASIYAASTLLSMLEYGALKYAFKGSNLSLVDPTKGKTIDITKSFLNKTPSAKGELAIAIGNSMATGGKAMVAEGGEEVVSGLSEFLMTNYGTETYKGQTITDLLTSNQARDLAITSFGAGAGAGGLASAPRTAKALVTDVNTRMQNVDAFNTVQKAGQNTSSVADAELKSAVTQQNIQDQVDTVKGLNEAITALDKATTVEAIKEIKPIIDNVLGTDINITDAMTVKEIKSTIMPVLNKTAEARGREAQLATTALRGVQEGVKGKPTTDSITPEATQTEIDNLITKTEATNVTKKPFIAKVFNAIIGNKDSISPIKAKEQFTTRTLKTMSNSALKALATTENIQLLSDTFGMDKKGKANIDTKFLTTAVNEELSKREMSDRVLDVGVATDKVKPSVLKTTSLGNNITEFNKVSESLNNLTDEADITSTKEALVNISNNVIETIKSMPLNELRQLKDNKMLDKFIGNVKLYGDVYKKLGLGEVEGFLDKLIQVNNKLIKTSDSQEAKRKFVIDVARSKTVVSVEQAQQALKDLETLDISDSAKNNVRATLEKAIKAVIERTKVAEADRDVQAKAQAKEDLDTIKQEIKDSDTIPEPLKEAVSKMNDDAVLQLYNTMGIDKNTLQYLQELGIDVNNLPTKTIKIEVEC